MEFIKSFLSFINENKEENFEDKIKGDGYFKGLSLSTARKKAAELKKQAAMDDDDPAAYGPLPGDTKGKKLLKPSKHTKKYQDLYGDEDESVNEEFINEGLGTAIQKIRKLAVSMANKKFDSAQNHINLGKLSSNKFDEKGELNKAEASLSNINTLDEGLRSTINNIGIKLAKGAGILTIISGMVSAVGWSRYIDASFTKFYYSQIQRLAQPEVMKVMTDLYGARASEGTIYGKFGLIAFFIFFTITVIGIAAARLSKEKKESVNEYYDEEVDEARSLSRGASKNTLARQKARNAEEMDREYIKTRQERDKIAQKKYKKDYKDLNSHQKDRVNSERWANEGYTGNSGDKLTHKYDKTIEIELIEPTNKGWKVYQTDKGNKRKIAYFDKQDIVGNKALFESVNEAELKLGVRYVNQQGKEGFIQTGGSKNPKDWFWYDGKTKHPYDKVKKELKPAKDQKKTGFSDYLKQGGRVWDNVNPSDSPPVNEETVYIDFLNKDKGFRPDRKYFKGKNAYDSAVKWAKNNFEKFNPDMIHYESMNEMSEDLLAEEYEALIVEKFSTITATGLTKKHKDDLIKMGANVKLSGPGWYIMVKTEDLKQALDYLEKEGIDVSESLNEKASGDRSPIDNDAIETGLEKKSEETGVPVPLLRIVMRRGMAAWKSGRRPGAGQEQWGYARVNSFLTKGPGTWGRPLKDPVKGGPKGAYGADADVAKEVIDGGHDKKLK